MSAPIPLDELSVEQKSLIKRELMVAEILSPTTPHFVQPKVVKDFFIDGDTHVAYIPYTWAKRKLSYNPDSAPNDSIVFNGELRDYQREPIQRAVDTILRDGSTIISAYCGFGKTITSLYIASKVGGPVAILYKLKSTESQWKEAKRLTNGHIDLISAFSINNYPQSQLEKYHMLIVDEVHLMAAETLTAAMLKFTPKYLLGLSATPTRPDGLDIILDYHFNKQHMTSVQKDKAVNVKVIWTGIVPEHKLNRSGDIDWNSIVNFLAESPEVNNCIIKQLLEYPDRRFMILCKRKTQIKLLEELCAANNIDVTTYYESMKAPKNPEARVLIGTDSKLGVGFDDTTRNTLILGCDIKGVESLTQYTGRIIHRTKDTPLIIDFVHDFVSLRRHWSVRKNFYESLNANIELVGFPAKNAPKSTGRTTLLKRPNKMTPKINET